MTKPYTITRIHRSGVFKSFWDHRLDQIGKEKSKLYKKVCQKRSDKDSLIYESLNKRIQQIVKNEKHDTFKEFGEGLLKA